MNEYSVALPHDDDDAVHFGIFIGVLCVPENNNNSKWNGKRKEIPVMANEMLLTKCY